MPGGNPNSTNNQALAGLQGQKDAVQQLQSTYPSQGLNLQHLQQQLGDKQPDQASQMQSQLSAGQQVQQLGKPGGMVGIGGIPGLTLQDQQTTNLGLMGNQPQQLQSQQLQQQQLQQ